jgi:hypothetical protein
MDHLRQFCKSYISLDQLSDSDIRTICQYYSVSSWLFPKERLTQKLKAILEDDAMLRRDGLDMLSEVDIEQALLDRGFLHLHTDPHVNREWLKNWIEWTCPETPLSMLLLCRLLHQCK